MSFPGEDEEAEVVDLFSFVINPDSFGQTIENIFHLSFLIMVSLALLFFTIVFMIIRKTIIIIRVPHEQCSWAVMISTLFPGFMISCFWRADFRFVFQRGRAGISVHDDLGVPVVCKCCIAAHVLPHMLWYYTVPVFWITAVIVLLLLWLFQTMHSQVGSQSPLIRLGLSLASIVSLTSPKKSYECCYKLDQT